MPEARGTSQGTYVFLDSSGDRPILFLIHLLTFSDALQRLYILSLLHLHYSTIHIHQNVILLPEHHSYLPRHRQ
jgi:hypothetical protein